MILKHYYWAQFVHVYQEVKLYRIYQSSAQLPDWQSPITYANFGQGTIAQLGFHHWVCLQLALFFLH